MLAILIKVPLLLSESNIPGYSLLIWTISYWPYNVVHFMLKLITTHQQYNDIDIFEDEQHTRIERVQTNRL